jgi:prefoldin subunit 5
VTKTNALGYTIDSLERQQTELKAEHNDLEIASARLQSLDRVQNSEASKNLVSVAPTATLQ